MSGVDLAAFFEEAWARFERASLRGTRRELRRIAGLPIALDFAGEGLAERLLPAFDHHRRKGEPLFRVGLWDASSTGVEAPPPMLPRGYFNYKGEAWGHTDPRYRLAFHWGSFSLKLADLETRRALYWVQDPERLPLWERASPLRSILHWLLPLYGRHLLHAAAVGIGGRAVVMPGPGGAGKSSTALSCLLDGMEFLGDDYVALRWDPEPRVYSLFSSAKVDVSQRQHFDALDGDFQREPTRDFDKLGVWLYPRWKRQIVDSLPLACTLLPRITGRERTEIGSVDPARVESAASEVLLGHLPGTQMDSLASCLRLARDLPRAELRLGRCRDSVAPIVRAALREPHSPPFSRPDRCDPEAELAAAPPVSVVVPVRDAVDHVTDAVASLEAQKHPRLEMILVDDASVDDGAARAKAAAPKLRCFTTWEGPAGPGVARNRGLIESWGPWIAFLDADDLWPEGSLAARLEALKREPGLDGVLGRCRVERWDAAQGRFVEDSEAPVPDRVPGAGLFRRSVFERVGLFREEWPFEDLEWFERAEGLGLRIGRLDETTLVVRRHPGCATSLGERHAEQRRQRVERLAQRRHRQSAADRRQELLYGSPVFCMAPWVHLNVTADGRVTPCCVANNELGHEASESVGEIWNGERFKAFRRRMLAGRPLPECQECQLRDRAEVPSLRRSFNRCYEDLFDWVSTTDETGYAKDARPVAWDIRFSNACNFRCRMCWHGNSSRWFEDARKLGVTAGPTPVLRSIRDPEALFAQLEEWLPDLRDVYFAGGEPLITDEHYRLLALLDERGMHETAIRYNTNFSQLTYKGTDVLDVWQRFRNVDLYASLDGIGARGELIRKDLSWPEFRENRERLRRRCPHVRLKLATTLSVFNVLHVPDMQRELVESGFVNVDQLVMNLLVAPERYSIRLLPRKLKEQVVTRYGEQIEWIRNRSRAPGTDREQVAQLVSAYEGSLSYLEREDWSHRIEEFLSMSEKLDALRNEDTKAVFPELALCTRELR